MPSSNLARGQPQIVDRAVFADFAPDIDPITPGILIDCSNAYPTVKGFRSYPSLVRYSTNNLPGTAFGVFSGAQGSADVLVAGVADQLYELVAKTFVSAGLSLGTITPPARWRFDMYGTDLIAVNGLDPVQMKPISGSFATLGGGPPVASIAQATDFSLFLIEANSSRWWSSLSDTIWTPSIATQTVRGNLDSTNGNISAAHALRSGIAIYKRKALHYGTFTGPPFYWDFVTVSTQIGAPSQEAIANLGDVQYFLGPDDFYAFDAQSLKRIPNNLKEWFFANYDQTKDYLVSARWEQEKSLIFWHFASLQSVGETIDLWICYNLRTGKWSKGAEMVDVPVFSSIQTGNLTYADFTATYPTYADVEGLRYGDLRSRAIDLSGVIKSADHGLYLYNGAPAGGYVTSHDFGDRHNMYQVTRLRPQFSVYPQSGAILEVLSQYRPGDAPVAGPVVNLSSDGWFNFRNTSRLQRFKITALSEMEITGVEAMVDYAGER